MARGIGTRFSAGNLRRVGLCGVLATLVVIFLARDALANEPPGITFAAVPLGGPNNVWKFSGTVTDEYVEGCTVTIGGIFDDVSVQVNPDGTYSYTRALEEGTDGWATAQAKDQSGLKSEVAEEFVSA